MKTAPRRFYGYLKKDFQLLYKRKKYLYIFIALPLIIALLFLFALNPKGYDIKVGVCDFDQSALSAKAYSSLDGFNPQIIEESPCKENLLDKIKQGKIDLGLIVPKDFEKNISNLRQANLEIYFDNTDIAFSNLIEWKVDLSLNPFKRQIIDSINQELNDKAKTTRTGIDFLFELEGIPAADKQLLKVDKDLKKLEDLETEFLIRPISTTKIPVYEAGLKKDAGIVFIFPILALFVTLMLSSTSIIYDKKTNFITRVKASSSPFSYLLAKTLFFTSLVLAQFILILGLFMIYGAKYALPLMPVIKLILFIGLINTLLGFIIGQIAKSEGIAVLFSLIISFPLMLISGIFFPVQALPKATQWISQILPLEHQINACKSVLLFGQNISNNWIIAAIILFTITYIFIKKE